MPWRDTDVRIEGPAAAQFQSHFLDTWAKQNGPALQDANYFPRLREPGSAIVRVIGTSPDAAQSASQAALLSAIEHAERSVHITNAYFVPDERMLRALEHAARAGVEVTLVLPSHSDVPAALYAGRAKYTRLLRAGVQIYERKAALLHAKTAVVDGVWSTVGSTNLDRRSLDSNDEIDAIVLGLAFGRQMEAMFLDDLRASQQIRPQLWPQRSVGSRLKELGAGLLERWL
jgi:cardiolipin synthase